MSKFLKIRVEKKEEKFRGCSLFVSGLKAKTKGDGTLEMSGFPSLFQPVLLASNCRSSNLFLTECETRIVNYGPSFLLRLGHKSKRKNEITARILTERFNKKNTDKINTNTVIVQILLTMYGRGNIHLINKWVFVLFSLNRACKSKNVILDQLLHVQCPI